MKLNLTEKKLIARLKGVLEEDPGREEITHEEVSEIVNSNTKFMNALNSLLAHVRAFTWTVRLYPTLPLSL